MPTRRSPLGGRPSNRQLPNGGRTPSGTTPRPREQSMTPEQIAAIQALPGKRLGMKGRGKSMTDAQILAAQNLPGNRNPVNPTSRRGKQTPNPRGGLNFMPPEINPNDGFNQYAAGGKRYGASGRDAPNIGPTSSPEGYAERDKKTKAKRNYMLSTLQKKKKGQFNSPQALRNQRPGTFSTK